MREILQSHLPIAPWSEERTRRLPGIQPVEPGDWLRVDDAYGAQMAERIRLLSTRPGDVHALSPAALPAAQELLERILTEIETIPGFERSGDLVRRPDGGEVVIDRAAPLMTLGHLVQEDLCLLEKPEGADEHVLTGAVVCFPARWTLAEKFMRPLIAIHRPVPNYDADIARRVQRLFDGVQAGRGLWRANSLFYHDPSLFSPRLESVKASEHLPPPRYLRSERQCLQRLPQSGAVVFSIHTYIVRMEDLSAEQKASLEAHPIHQV